VRKKLTKSKVQMRKELNEYYRKLEDFKNLLTIAKTDNNQERTNYYQTEIKKLEQNIEFKQQLLLIIKNKGKRQLYFFIFYALFLLIACFLYILLLSIL
jgi:GTPase involved in cell partitioning and DNA repair